MESLIFFSGVQTFGNYGFVASHSSYDGTISYGNNYRKSWHLRVSQGYRVKITFLDFELEGCCDYLYITWDACNYQYGAHSVRLGGRSLSTTVFYSPPKVNNVNLYFSTDGSVTYP